MLLNINLTGSGLVLGHKGVCTSQVNNVRLQEKSWIRHCQHCLCKMFTQVEKNDLLSKEIKLWIEPYISWATILYLCFTEIPVTSPVISRCAQYSVHQTILIFKEYCTMFKSTTHSIWVMCCHWDCFVQHLQYLKLIGS